MKVFRSAVTALALLGMFGLGVISCAQKTTEDKEAAAKVVKAMQAQDEATIRAIDNQWVQAVAAKDAEQAASFYANGGTLMAPGAPIATGQDAIRKTWTSLMGTPGFALTFAPTKIDVSRAGDLAYELGDYQLTLNGKGGKPQTVKAKYVVVWGKQADGSWKVLVDAPTTAH